jgi:hypothetical protein
VRTEAVIRMIRAGMSSRVARRRVSGGFVWLGKGAGVAVSILWFRGLEELVVEEL